MRIRQQFQLLLPTALLPDNGNSMSFIDNRLGEFPGTLTDQLGLGEHPLVGIGILGLAAAGAVIGVRRRPTLDGPLLLLALGSALLVSTHLRKVDRYWFQVTPWVLYFATVALLAIGQLLFTRRQQLGRALALAPLAIVVVAHLVVMPGQVGDALDYNAAGRVQSGPSNPKVAPVFDAVSELTPPDAIVAYFRARTMTLLTDRRSFQTKNLERIANNADYFAHWLSMPDRTDVSKLPKIFFVNWFRRDEDGRFLWPGFGENSRVLKWVFERVDGSAEAVDTPIGRLPTQASPDLDGLDIDQADLDAILSVEPDGWKDAIPQIREHYAKYGDKLPAQLQTAVDTLEAQLS